MKLDMLDRAWLDIRQGLGKVHGKCCWSSKAGTHASYSNCPGCCIRAFSINVFFSFFPSYRKERTKSETQASYFLFPNAIRHCYPEICTCPAPSETPPGHSCWHPATKQQCQLQEISPPMAIKGVKLSNLSVLASLHPSF